MVKLNDSNFTLYEQDTQTTILDRIAVTLNTLPKYLYFPHGIPDISEFRSKSDIIVENLLQTIIDSEMDFPQLWNDIEGKETQQNLDIFTDILEPFIFLNESLEKTADPAILDTLLLVLQQQISAIPIFSSVTIRQIEDINRNGKILRDRLTSQIQINITNVEDQVKIFNTIKTTKPVDYTPFELERMNFELTFEVKNMSNIEIFNLIKLSTLIPFCAYDKFYKILKDFLPDESWSISIPNMIILKVLQKKPSSFITLKDYIDIIIEEKGDGIFSLIGTINIEKDFLTKKDIIDNIFSVLNIQDYKVLSTEDYNIRGAFYFPKSTLDIYVMKDLILTNGIFSAVLAIDESQKATTEKDSIYIHFYNKTGNVKAVLTEKISHKKDPLLKGKDIVKVFPFGQEYIRVKISIADNNEAIKEFQNIFSRLLSIYYQEYDSIVDFYRQYIPTFGNKVPKKIPHIAALKNKDIAPEIFVANYPSKCPKAPTIIPDEDLEQNADGTFKRSENGTFFEKGTNKMVMRYPLTDDEGLIHRNYVCKWDKHIYPGLTRKNDLENKDLTQYLPCCYEKNHTLPNAGTPFRYYYFDEDVNVTKPGVQTQFITTSRVLPPKFYGFLPYDLSKSFELFVDDDKLKMLRKGIYKTPSSLLECVLTALWEGEYKDFYELDSDEKHHQYLMKLRETMATNMLASTCRQEMYDFTTEEIIEALTNPKAYLDPSYFVHILEIYFDCTIYIFSRPKNKVETKLIIPRHLQGYYRNKTEKRTIFIYEHWGTKSDNLSWPHCELIVQSIKGKDDQTIDIFNWNQKVSVSVDMVFHKLNDNYHLNTHINDIVFPYENPNIEFVSQSIDSYGKCRLLHFIYKKQILGTFLTTPIVPLLLEENSIWVVTPIDHQIAMEIIKELGIQITKQNVVNHVTKGYTGILGNVEITIPILESVPDIDIPEFEQGIGYPENNTSVLVQYNKYKKLARYITAYLLWLYSKFLHETGKPISLQTMFEFQQQYIEFVPTWEYNGSVGKIFDIDNKVIMKNKKLIVKSEETLKRLMYVLRTNTVKIPDYYKKVVIENYYEDVTDFDQYQFQIILQGEYSVEKWIDEHNSKNKVYNYIDPKLDTPYFFKNSLIGEQIFLAQNTDSQSKAIHIWKTWKSGHYNIGYNPDIEEESMNYILYSYRNPADIIKYQVGKPAEDIRVVGYKVEEDMLFTILLPL